MPDAPDPRQYNHFAALARAALAKRAKGEKPSREETRALEWIERETEERHRWEYYRTIPKKHWVQMSGRQHKVLDDQARTYGLPIGGKTIDLPALAKCIHDLLAEHGAKIVSQDKPAEKSAKDLHDEEKYLLAKMERLRRAGQLGDLETMRAGHTQIVAILRGLGDALKRECGDHALEILNEGLADAERVFARLATEQQSENQPPPEPSS